MVYRRARLAALCKASAPTQLIGGYRRWAINNSNCVYCCKNNWQLRTVDSTMSDIAERPIRITLTKSQLSTQRGSELFVILSEITADGLMSNAEIERLRVWLNADTKDKLPAESHLLELLKCMLANGKISADERLKLQKELERILPPSQRLEAKQARERMEASFKKIADIPIEIGTDCDEEETPFEEPPSRLEAKQTAQKNALLAAVRAAETKPKSKGETEYEIKLPERRPYEPKATLKQKDLLWALGIKDQVLLEALGKWQASAMIDQIKKQNQQKGNKGCALILTAVFIIAILAYILF